MNICVINGSPKGGASVTLQTCLYLEKRFPEHSFTVLHAGQRIRTYEKDMTDALKAMETADALLFAYPVYTFLAPSQLHRFIALMKASGADFSGKYVTQLTTSKHFYDVTAHRYIEDNCHDMKMKVVHGLSADMDDLLTEQGRRDAESFLKFFAYCVENDICEPTPAPNAPSARAALPEIPETPKEDGFDTVIVADIKDGDNELPALIEYFRRVYPFKTRLVTLGESPLSGGCFGCFHCAADGKCVYKDGFDSFLRESIQTADAVVYAFTISDHSMGARFKMYDDRQFCNGHRTVTEGMPFGYIVSGDYENEPNLRTVIEARCEVGHNFLGGAGFDAESLEGTARRLAYAVREKYVQPRSFYGVGGMKIFRDLIWLMRGLMKADHEFYKSHGIYDFPQKKRGDMLKMCLLGALIRSPKVSSKLGGKMTEGMLAPYRKVLERTR